MSTPDPDHFLAPLPASYALQQAARLILQAIGEDPEREGLVDTPRRFAEVWMEFLQYKDDNRSRNFSSIEADQNILVKDIRVWSFCEHHLLPFWAKVTIAYLAKDRVLGLSKFARIAEFAAHRLQTQERLAKMIADELEIATESPDVAVLCSGEHTCMTMRGVKKEAELLNVVVRGLFRTNDSTRSEFFSLARD